MFSTTYPGFAGLNLRILNFPALQSLKDCRSATLVVKVYPTVVVNTRATSNPQVRHLATAPPRRSGSKITDEANLRGLRRQLSTARNPARQEQLISGFRAILEQEMKIRQSPQDMVLLRMAEGIFDFIGETNLACGCVCDKS